MPCPMGIEIEEEVSHQDPTTARQILADALATRAKDACRKGGPDCRALYIEIVDATFEESTLHGHTTWIYKMKIKVNCGTEETKSKPEILFDAIWKTALIVGVAFAFVYVAVPAGIELILGGGGAAASDPEKAGKIIKIGEELVKKLAG